jgi:hypothetical protein
LVNRHGPAWWPGFPRTGSFSFSLCKYIHITTAPMRVMAIVAMATILVTGVI